MFEKYKFRKYNKKFSELFRREKIKLKKILPQAKIEHIGSTSVRGLGGKGIIDIIISVNKKYIKKAVKLMQERGYILKHSNSKERKYLEKHYKYRRVHLHLTSNNHLEWKRVIAFRDYLRKHKDKVREYAKIKREAVEYAKGDAKKYKKYKKKFIDKLEKGVIKEYGKLIMLTKPLNKNHIYNYSCKFNVKKSFRK